MLLPLLLVLPMVLGQTKMFEKNLNFTPNSLASAMVPGQVCLRMLLQMTTSPHLAQVHKARDLLSCATLCNNKHLAGMTCNGFK